MLKWIFELYLHTPRTRHVFFRFRKLECLATMTHSHTDVSGS